MIKINIKRLHSNILLKIKNYMKKTIWSKKTRRIYCTRIRKIFPVAVDTVKMNGNEYLGINYNSIIPLLVEGLKESNKKIKSLESKVKSLEKK